MKIDRGETFLLVETLPAATYHHAHLPGAINLPPEKVTELAQTLLPDKHAEIVVYSPIQRDTRQRTPPVIWRRWDTVTCGIMPRANRTGLTQD